MHELFLTERAAERHPDLLRAAHAPDEVAAGARHAGASPHDRAEIRVSLVTERAAAGLSETTTPQGVVAVCATLGTLAGEAVRGARLAAVLAGVADPGNAGTVTRVADAAGADAVVFAGPTVDPHNGKCVRASTGSLFHVALGVEADPLRAVGECRRAGLQVLAADGRTGRDLDEVADSGALAAPTAWLFGSEAHGLSADLLAAADDVVAVPLHGRAESLNLATAAAVCLYASARAHRDRTARTGVDPIT